MSEEQAGYDAGAVVGVAEGAAAGAAAGVVAAGESGAAARDPGASAVVEALTLAREALVAAHPDAVAELIRGGTAAELKASVAAAKAAYATAAERVRQQIGEQAVPAGGATRSEQGAVDVSALSPSAKISTAIERRNARG